jgi:cell division protein FtsI/penicillin-binding protein 2
MPLVIDQKAYDIYRSTFKEYGLGVKTGIDLPLEGLGVKGGSDVSGHLLDFAIGQYDTYTPLQLVQYINTIANGGSRIGLHFLREVHAETMANEIGKLESTYEPVIFNKVNTDIVYSDRIRLGFREVVRIGIGKGFMGNIPNPAGKTGTSQSFIDTDGDGKIDKETISNAFVGYYPADHPIMSIVTISPDVSHGYSNSNFRTSVNKRITSQISEKFFDIYK